MNILVGADPELFVKQHGKHVSGYGLIPGTKHDPHKVERGAVQVDGMALEFNIDPAKDELEFITNLETVMGILSSMVPEHELHADPVAHFTEQYLSTQPHEALDLGCDPDYNAYTRIANEKPNVKLPFRTGAGHIHVGVVEGEDPNNGDFFNVCADAVREMDFFLGLPSLFYDNDTQRREMYGKAGAFRAKPYGFEYRTLSNRWLSDKRLMSWAYKATHNCMESFFSGRRLFDEYGDIQSVINGSDKTEARKIVRSAGLLMPEGV